MCVCVYRHSLTYTIVMFQEISTSHNWVFEWLTKRIYIRKSIWNPNSNMAYNCSASCIILLAPLSHCTFIATCNNSACTYLLTPWSTVLLEKLTCFQLVKKFVALHGTCPPPVPILSQLDPVHTPKSHSLKIHLNIILPSMPGSPKWPLSSRFPHQNPVYASHLPHTCYMPRPSNSSRFYHLNNIGWAVQIIKFFII